MRKQQTEHAKQRGSITHNLHSAILAKLLHSRRSGKVNPVAEKLLVYERTILNLLAHYARTVDGRRQRCYKQNAWLWNGFHILYISNPKIGKIYNYVALKNHL